MPIICLASVRTIRKYGSDKSNPASLARAIAPFAAYSQVRPEVRYGQNSRIDFLLTGDGLPDAYVEVKSVTLCRQPGLAEFPDSVTARGAKHLVELADMARAGHRAVMLYLVQRTDCQRFDLAGDIDPTYRKAYDAARASGVETFCFGTDIGIEAVSIGEALEIST